MRNRSNPYCTPAWRQLSAAVTARDGACVECGSTDRLSAAPTTTSHGPRAAPDAPENLVTLCAACHGRLEASRRAV